jgi:hypothetical protein
MDSVTSKSGSFLYAGIGILILLGFVGPIIGLEMIPLWVSIIFWAIAFSLFFSIRKTTFTKDSISTTFFLIQRTIDFKRDEIRSIRFIQSSETSASKKGLIKQNRIIQITRDNGKTLIIDEKANTNFQAIHDLLKKHYSNFFVR